MPDQIDQPETETNADHPARGRRQRLLPAIMGMLIVLGLLAVGGMEYYTYRVETTVEDAPPKRPYHPAPFVTTPPDVVDRMLAVADIRKDDLLYDLGSGDGRIVIAAARDYGCRAVGFEFDHKLVKMSREKIQQAGLEDRVSIEEKDFGTVDLSRASVITMYLLPHNIKKLRPRLERLKPGTRVVCHDYGPEWVEPDRVERFRTRKDNSERTVYLYVWK